MTRRSSLGIIFALALAVVAALVAWNYTQGLQTQLQEARNQAEQNVAPAPVATATPIPLVDVVVASSDVPARTRLAATWLKVVQVPREARLPQAITRIEDADGKITQFPIASGEQILPMKFTTVKSETGLAYTIPPGKLAIAVNASDVIDVGGLIQLGDRVDVFATFDKETMGKDTSMLFLQNVEVLAVAQHYQGEPVVVPTPAPQSLPEKAVGAVAGALTPSASPTGQTVSASPTAAPVPSATATAVPARPAPEAKTVTLAVSPDEAERLVLAEKNGQIRFALRPAADSSIANLQDATLSTIRTNIAPAAALITGVRISPTDLRAGDTLKVEITVKNTSDKTIASQDPKPEFTYIQGQTYYSEKYPSQAGKLRVGINIDGQASAPFPYRWGLGGDLPPGSSTTVVGYIKLTYDIKPTNFWAGLIHEPENVIQDNEGITLVTVVPVNVAVVSVDAANVRSGPDISSSVVGKLAYGTQVPILSQEKDWFRVQLPDGKTGFVAAGWIIAPQAAPATGAAAPTPTAASR